nr:Hypothetical protein CBG21842 [Haemonchus contortus]
MHWDPNYIDLDPHYIMISATPLVAQLKINLTLTIAIALERTLALRFPMTYRRLSSSPYATYSLLIGCLLAILDLILEFTLTPFERHPDCAAIGCFLSETFRYYWGISNMLLGTVVIVLSFLIMAKLRSIKKDSQVDHHNQDMHKFTQANRISAGILMSSLLFITIPSVFVGSARAIGYSIFKFVGPFYIVGLLCAGFCNSILYIVLNKEMRDQAKKYIFGKGVKMVLPPSKVDAVAKDVTTIKTTSPVKRQSGKDYTAVEIVH